MPLQISISNVIDGRNGGGARCAKALPATNVGNTYFTANWQPYTNAYYYEIDLSTDPNFGSFVYENLIVHVINYNYSYEFIGLTPGTTYYYRVRAVVDEQFGVFFDGYTMANSYSEVNTTSDNRSSVFEEFSLLGYPSALYEDVIYTQIPKDDSGNLIFTRASDGTRVTPSGLIGDVPWNKAQYSNAFNNSSFWNNNNNIIKTPAAIANPIDGSMDGWRVQAAANGGFSFFSSLPPNFSIQGYSQTESIFVKAGSCFVVGLRDGQVTAQEAVFNIANGSIISNLTNVGDRWFIQDYGDGWYRIGKTALGLNVGMRIEFYRNEKVEPALAGQFCYVYGYQWVESAIDNPLPYIQTTDRLNMPRLDWKNNQPGILMEGQRTNLIRYSQDLNVTGGIWDSNASGSLTPNVATAPDGTQSADRLTCSTNGYSGWYQSYTTGRVVNSIYAKYENTRYLSVVDPTGTANGASFDLINGTVAYVRSNVLAYIENAGNGWYRCVWWENSNGSGYSLIQLWLDSTPGSNGGVGGSCLLWGAQVESMENISNRTYASSYIRTFATSVTRLSDVASTATIPTLIGQTEGSVFVDFEFTQYRNSGIFNLASAQSPNWAHSTYAFQQSGGIWLQIYSNGTLQGTLTAYGMADKSRQKLLFVYKQNDFRFYLNGALVASQTTGTPSLNLQRLDLITDNGSTADADRPFSKLYAYGLIKRALTNAEAIAITTPAFEDRASLFFDRVSLAGGSLSYSEKSAINNLVYALIGADLWDDMIAIYPFVGASAAACSQNLISSSFTGSFSSGWTFSSQGVQGNGTSAFFDTNLEWSSNTSIYDVSVGAYLNTFNFNGSYYGIGNGGYYVAMRMGNDHYINNNANTGVVGAMATGLHILSRSNSSTQEFFINGVNSSASDLLDPKQKPVGDFYFGAGNGSNLAGNFNSSRHALGFVSRYLDSNKRINFYNIVRQFQIELSRNV